MALMSSFPSLFAANIVTYLLGSVPDLARANVLEEMVAMT